MLENSGRVALITGASGALGSAVTAAFCKAGMKVAAAATRWPADAAQKADCALFAANLMVPAEASLLVEQTIAKFGRLDALVHLAGGFAGGQPIEESLDEDWDRMWNLNLRTAVNVIRAAIPPMRAARRGRILAVGSKAGADSPAGLAPYAASKAALHAVIKVVAEEVRMTGITANAVLPSVIDTPVNRKAFMESDPARFVKPESIASLLLWLCSGAAGDVNGALVPIYGRV